MNTATAHRDTFGVLIERGDVVRVLAWGTPVRLSDVGRTAVVEGFTRAGNVVLRGWSANPADDIARGRAVSPGMLGVLDRRDRDNRVAAGYEGNRARCLTCGDHLDAPTGAGAAAACASTHAAKVGA